MNTKKYWIMTMASFFMICIAIIVGGFAYAMRYYGWYTVCFFTAIASTLSSIWFVGKAARWTVPRNHPLSKIYKQLDL